MQFFKGQDGFIRVVCHYQKRMAPINVLVHYLKNIFLLSVENDLMEKHAEDLDAMNLPFNWRYIPIDYPQPEDCWPEKFEENI